MSSINKKKENSRQIGKMLFMYAEEAVHVGAGSSTGTIDKPIQREKHTGLPKFEGSGNKGSAREASWDRFTVTFNEKETDKTYAELKTKLLNNSSKIETVFSRFYGYKDKGDKHSAIDIPDAQLLFFPVRSWKGVFAWITSPYLLGKYARDHKRIYGKELKINGVPKEIDDNEIITTTSSNIQFKVNDTDKVLLEEFLFNVKEATITIDNKAIGDWIMEMFGGEKNINNLMKMLKTNVAVVSDDVLIDFADLYTVKITRNKIDSATGVAKGTALFNEEYLPSDSILYTPIIANQEFKENGLTANEVMCFVENNLPDLYKIGGDKNIGKGLLRTSFYPPKEKFETNKE